LNFKQLMHAFFGLGDDVDFHYIDCCLVSGLYINIQVSSQVIITFDKSGSFSTRCKRSKHSSLQHSFCSSDSTYGTIFAQTSLMFNSSLRIHRTLSLSKLTSSATARTSNLRSFRISVVIGNSCAWTAWAIIIFQAFSAFQKSFVPFKHTCMRHAIFTVNLSQ